MEDLMQITAGRGPAECCMVVYNFFKVVLKRAAYKIIDAKNVVSIEGQLLKIPSI
jgi:protein subunit release factor B